MYFLTKWEGQTKNIWFSVMTYGHQFIPSLLYDQEPNIFHLAYPESVNNHFDCLSSFLNALTCCSLWPYCPQNTSIHGGIFCKWCFSIRVQTGPYESYDISHNFTLQQWIVFKARSDWLLKLRISFGFASKYMVIITGINEIKSSFRAVSSQSCRIH